MRKRDVKKRLCPEKKEAKCVMHGMRLNEVKVAKRVLTHLNCNLTHPILFLVVLVAGFGAYSNILHNMQYCNKFWSQPPTLVYWQESTCYIKTKNWVSLKGKPLFFLMITNTTPFLVKWFPFLQHLHVINKNQ